MKKWLCALSVCAVTGLGAFGFAGCTNNDEISAIKIKTLPTTTEFTVGETITDALYDGVFTIHYANGRKTDMHLNNADIVYVDYADGTTSNKFNQPAKNQVVVVRYQDKSTTFNVKVVKEEMDLNYTKSYQTTYNGSVQKLDKLLDLNLPNGAFVSKIEYRLRTAHGSEEFVDTPLSAGTYETRITINGGTRFNSLVLDDITYVINKADITKAMLDKTVTYGPVYMEFGDAVDATRNWRIDNSTGDIFTNALKSEFYDLTDYIQYAYRPSDKAEYTILSSTGGKVLLNNLQAGSYKLRAFARNMPNFADFYYETDLTVAAKELKFGIDYDIVVNHDGAKIDYVQPQTAMSFVTQIATDNPSSVQVQVVIKNERAASILDGSVTIYFVASEHNLAHWQGEGATSPSGFYDYKLVLSAHFRGDTCYFDDVLHGIQIIQN